MNKLYVLGGIWLIGLNYLSTPTLAQGNYVANTSNSSTPGTFNTLLGPGAGSGGSLTGDRNTATGYNAGFALTSGNHNSFYGVDAGRFTTTGANNVFSGYQAGINNTAGHDNLFTGVDAGHSNQTGNYNVFTGVGAGYSNVQGSYNVFTGNAAGYFNTFGIYNVFTGNAAGYYNTEGNNNVFTGISAGYSNTTGSFNVFTGSDAGYFNTTGTKNVFVGYEAGVYNKAGSQNAFLGYHAGYNSTADNNTFIGSLSGQANTSGSFNTCIGNRAGSNNTTGNNNIIIGPNSGTAITNSNDNILMGYNSQALNGLRNAVAIGTNARVASNNAIVLGNPDNTSIAVGIGTDSPQFPLDVRGIINLRNNGTIKFSHLSNPNLRNGTTDQFLTVNEQGETVLAHYRLRIDNVNQWSDRVFSSAYSLRPLSSVATYVRENGHLPGVPTANEVVKDGVDLVKMNATLLEKVEELTLYLIQQQKRIEQLENQVRQIAKP